jgi:DNA-directed RNA polymerase
MAEPGDTVDKRRQIMAFPPNFIHSLDASALVFAVLYANREHGITAFSLIHDSFATHAGGEGSGDSQRLAICLRKAFVDMYSHNDVLQQLLTGLKLPEGTEVPAIPDRGGLNIDDVLKSTYFFA